MAGRLGSVDISPAMPTFDDSWRSPEVEGWGNSLFVWANTFQLLPIGGLGGRKYDRYSLPNNYPVGRANVNSSFFLDYYFRIHINPLLINLGTVASTQTRQVSLWNSYLMNAHLSDISINNGSGITVSGREPPAVINALEELVYDVSVSTSGPPTINADIFFMFDDVDNPLPVEIKGTRAIRFDLIPEVPVNEILDYMTDEMVSIDGSEQRLAIRGDMPRVSMQSKYIFVDQSAIRAFSANLANTRGRLWLPEYQYATLTTQASASGTFKIYFDPTRTDIRDGEYALVVSKDGNSRLVEVATVDVDGATLAAALLIDVGKDDTISPGAPVILPEGSGIGRYSVNDVANFEVTSQFQRFRSSYVNPNRIVALPTFLGLPVFEPRPLANSLVDDDYTTGNYKIDNQTGYFEVNTHWDYSRVGGKRSFKVNRAKSPEKLDLAKTLISYARGKQRKFWMSTYRPDFQLVSAPSDATNTYTVSGEDYVDKFYPIPTHRYIEITTAAGTHRASITSAVKSLGNTIIGFTPAVPAGSDWQNVKLLSFLLPVRLDSDKITLKHYWQDTTFDLQIRTAEI